MAQTELEKALQLLGGPASGLGPRVIKKKWKHLGWVDVIRSGLPSGALESTGRQLRISLKDLSTNLRLPGRTLHRRIEKGERLTSEETERLVRLARAAAKAQELLGEDSGMQWVRRPCRGLAGETPLSMLDTADGFISVMDELGRLEFGVVS